MKILFADDDSDALLCTTDFLQQHGHVVTPVLSGGELLRRLDPEPLQFDTVVVTHNDVPGNWSGIHSLRLLRRNPRYQILPIIVYGAASHVKDEAGLQRAIYAEKMSTHQDLLQALEIVEGILHRRKNP